MNLHEQEVQQVRSPVGRLDVVEVEGGRGEAALVYYVGNQIPKCLIRLLVLLVDFFNFLRLIQIPIIPPAPLILPVFFQNIS